MEISDIEFIDNKWTETYAEEGTDKSDDGYVISNQIEINKIATRRALSVKLS